MAADLPLVLKTWQALGPALAEEKCAGCDCLQAALVELKLALEELPALDGHAALLADVEQAMRRGEPHACLGCEPCHSGTILVEFYREQQAREAAPEPATCDG